MHILGAINGKVVPVATDKTKILFVEIMASLVTVGMGKIDLFPGAIIKGCMGIGTVKGR
jgi:hypothetical protein